MEGKETRLKIIPINKREGRRCYFCGTSKSVKYTVRVSDSVVCCCNKCAAAGWYGKSDTVADEIVRAVSRIAGRFYHDGDRLGIACGEETCDPAGRYLMQRCGESVAQSVHDAWNVEDNTYQKRLEKIMQTTALYLDEHPELFITENNEDMLTF